MTPQRILLYVQNLLGIGHLRRAAAVARALDAAGLEVTFVTGGMPVPHLPVGGSDWVQLPPVRTRDNDFKVLVDETDQPIDDAFRERRRDVLLKTFDDVRPDAVITELFPFGRRQMRFELIPLLEAANAARPRPVMLSSMRDILVTKPRADRNQEIVDTFSAYYDHALIHADPELITLDRTFPMAEGIRDRLIYTGYVVNMPEVSVPDADPRDTGEVLISAGGGAVGAEMVTRLVEMMPDLPLGDRTWRLITGHHMPEAEVAKLRAIDRPNLIIERSRPDLPALMAHSALSISQAGYNTLLELLAVRARSVVIPFEGGVETEQRLRADLLAGLGALEMVPEDHLDAPTLSAAMRAAYDRPRDQVPPVDLDGAANAARIVRHLIDERRA
jgi:predicted glycosyltransferase